MPEDEGDVSELARCAREGDRAAFEALVHRLVRPALAVAWELVETREDAEDVVQEAFARTWRKLERYDPARPFAPWFFTVVRNAARNARRRGEHGTVLSLDEDMVERIPGGTSDPDPLERLVHDERVHSLLDELSPMQRTCFRLAEIEGFSREEVADMLGVTPATVRVHIHRARHALRALPGVGRGGSG